MMLLYESAQAIASTELPSGVFPEYKCATYQDEYCKGSRQSGQNHFFRMYAPPHPRKTAMPSPIKLIQHSKKGSPWKQLNANYGGSIFKILNWNANAHSRRFPFALVLFLELRNLVCPKPVARRFPFRRHGRRRANARHRSSTLPSLCGLLRLERIAARKGYNPKFCASCIFYL